MTAMQRDRSFMRAVFGGDIAEEQLFPYPEVPGPERSRLGALLPEVRSWLAKEVDAQLIDRHGDIEPRIFDGLRELGLFGITTSQGYGGLGFSAMGHSRIMQEVAAVDSSVALTLLVHEVIGTRAIARFGTEQQKQRYLRRLASGRSIAAFGFTEQPAGSDAASIRCHAAFDEATQSYRINGEKSWVCNAELADVFVVFARTRPADEGKKPALTAFILEAGPGVTVGQRLCTSGVRGAHVHPILLKDAIATADQVLDEPGKGMKIAASVLSEARIVLAAAMLGQCRAVIDASTKRLRVRRSSGRTIGEFAMMKDGAARMLAETYAAESMTFLTAGFSDRGQDVSLESAIAR
ncbi:MAG TPA: acyl-CoA dehydrogenase family protein, partial [Polyangiaceae bacterium]